MSLAIESGAESVQCPYESASHTWTCTDGEGSYGYNEFARISLGGPGTLEFTQLFANPVIGIVAHCQGDGIEIYDENGTRLAGHCKLNLLGTYSGPYNVQDGSSLVIKWFANSDTNMGNAQQRAGFTFTFTKANPTCPLGQEATGGSCTPCSTGRYKNVTGPKCTEACPAGKFGNTTGSTSADQCHQCVAGTYAGAEGSATCAPCARGRYENVTQSTNCNKLCPAGTFGDATGSTSAEQCQGCVAGKHASAPGSTSCAPCAKGRYENAARRYVFLSRRLISMVQ